MKQGYSRCFYLLGFATLAILIYLCIKVHSGSGFKIYRLPRLATVVSGVELTSSDHVFATRNPTHTGRTNLNQTHVIEVLSNKIFLFSAFAINYHTMTIVDIKLYKEQVVPKTDNNYSSIKLIAWTHTETLGSNFYCCLLLHNKAIQRHPVYLKVNRGYFPKLEVSQFFCPLPTSDVGVTYVSLVINDMVCPMDTSKYVIPIYPSLHPQPGLAVCCKVIYGTVDAKFLVEWFEIQRMLGVTKAVFYLYKVKDDAMAVLNYYKKIGIAELYPFDYPEKDSLPRNMEDKEPQVFTDAVATLYDCIERLRRYKYVSIMDIDEVIMPNYGPLNGSLPRTLDMIWKKYPKIGAVMLKTRFHILHPNVSLGDSLLTATYNTCSNAVLDRPKSIYKPSLVQPTSVTTHEVKVLSGYKRKMLEPHELVIHHYRRRRMQLKEGAELVFKDTCSRMTQVSAMVKNRVQMVQQQLDLL